MAPGLTLLVSTGAYLLIARLSDQASDLFWTALPALYVAPALWWLVRACRAPRPAWPHLAAVWLVAAPPILLLASIRSDVGFAMATLTYLPALAVLILACLVATMIIILREA